MTGYNGDTTIDNDQREDGPTIEYDGNGIEITIDPSIAVIALNSDAISSDHSGSKLTNNGNVFSAGLDGAVFFGDGSSVVNNADASIGGYGFGVLLGGDGAELTNHGAISGLMDAGVSLSDNYALNNDGDIWGRFSGVNISSKIDGGIIDNSGMIRGDSSGMYVLNDPGVTAEIHNEAGGLIQGSMSAIFTDDEGGLISLDNRGTVDGSIDLNATTGNVNDVVKNRGEIKGDVFLGLGDDKYKGKSDGTSGHVFGEDGDDRLIGSKAKDYLDGGADKDLLRGGKGKDKQFGGADSDTFDFNSIKDSVVGSKRDKIIDFQRGDDEIDLKGIDAKKGSGNQTFKWIGDKNFHDKKGELRIKDKGSKVIVQGDVKGDGKADFEILVKGVGELSDDDFVL
jgi:Ca2+-binding RTX toxin-like protein